VAVLRYFFISRRHISSKNTTTGTYAKRFIRFWCKGVPFGTLVHKFLTPAPKSPKITNFFIVKMRFLLKNNLFTAVIATQKLYIEQERLGLRILWSSNFSKKSGKSPASAVTEILIQ